MLKLKSLYQKVTQKTAKKRVLFFLLGDIILIPLAIFLAFLLRFDGKIPDEYFGGLIGVIFLTLFFSLPIFYLYRLYSFSWTYISTSELISLIKAVSLTLVLLTITLYFTSHFPLFSIFPRSTLFISYFLILFFCGGFRFLKRIYLELSSSRKQKEKKRTLIVGAGDAGEEILRSIFSSQKKSPYWPIGFVDDDPLKQGMMIHGLKVLGKINDIIQIGKAHQIESMIIALPTAGSSVIKKAVEKGRELGLKEIKIVPSIVEIIDGRISLQDLKELQIEDLLAREPISLKMEEIQNFITDKKILITGAAGSIGSELSRQIARFKPAKIILLDQEETGIFCLSEDLRERFLQLEFRAVVGNIQDRKKIDLLFKEEKPEIVFHAAAYKHVPVMEEHCDEAVKNNIFGTKIMAEIALKYKVKNFVYISTDKAINPTSVMGATKRVGEMICQALNDSTNGETKFVSVRFGNVLDSRGNVISLFKKQIAKGGPVKVTHPQMKRYFMTCPEACLLVMKAAALGQGGEVFILDMGEAVRIVDLARELIRLSGFEPDRDIPIVFTEVRPGEKLFEEILTAEEGTVATQDKKIFKAKLPNIDKKKLYEALQKLRRAAQQGNNSKIKAILKELIPFYHPAS